MESARITQLFSIYTLESRIRDETAGKVRVLMEEPTLPSIVVFRVNEERGRKFYKCTT